LAGWAKDGERVDVTIQAKIDQYKRSGGSRQEIDNLITQAQNIYTDLETKVTEQEAGVRT
jgi:hypothetical protein